MSISFNKMTNTTKRSIYLSILIVIVILGLLSRNLEGRITEIIDVKDVAWAMMVYFLFRIVFLSWPIGKVALAMMIFSVVIEVSQLYHAGWIDRLRETFMGAIVLGSAFVWTDFIAYLAGAILGSAIDYILYS